MLSRMKLVDEGVRFIVANNVQGLITIDDFSQLNDKSVEVLYWLLRRPEGTTWRGVQSWGCSVSNG